MTRSIRRITVTGVGSRPPLPPRPLVDEVLLGEATVDRPTIPTTDEMDIAVRLVVAAADERRVLEGREVSVDLQLADE